MSPGNWGAARAGLPDARVRRTELASGGKATFAGLIEALSKGPDAGAEGYDILYLVAHGALIDGRPLLYLERTNGEVAVANGDELAARLRDLPRLPRLAVLVSCKGAGTGRTADIQGALAALGPLLAEAGVPAVVAMQGSVPMDLMTAFIPAFFGELLRSNPIDRAVAAGRGAVLDQITSGTLAKANRDDIWMPALFMRLRSGMIWFGGGPGDGGFDQWPSLIQAIANRKCTPILGSGMVEAVTDSLRRVARRWADTYHFPMSPHGREDLPQVAQYLAVNYSSAFPGFELTDYLRRELLRRFPRPGLAEAVRSDLLRQDPPAEDPVTALRRALRKRSPEGAVTNSLPGLADLIRVRHARRAARGRRAR